MRRLVSAAAIAVALTSAAEAGVSCYVGADAGKTITSTRVNDDFSGPVTIAADGLQVGARLGCDYEVPGIMHGVVVGLYGGVDMQDVSTRIDAGSISSDLAWTAAARAGVKINPGTLVYAIGGMSWTEISYPGELAVSPRGYVFGAGIELDIGIPNLSAYAEWSRTTWGKASDFDVTIRPESDTIRLGVKIKFGAIDKVTP